MKNKLLLIISIFVGISALAETIAIKNPGYFDNPIRDGYAVFPDTLYFDKYAEEITFPDMGTFVKFGDYDFPNLRKVTLNSVDYIPGGTFGGMKNLYIISANLLNQSEPEGKSNHMQGYIGALVPQGSNYKNAHYITTDSDWFWQRPIKFVEHSKPKSEMIIR